MSDGSLVSVDGHTDNVPIASSCRRRPVDLWIRYAGGSELVISIPFTSLLTDVASTDLSSLGIRVQVSDSPATLDDLFWKVQNWASVKEQTFLRLVQDSQSRQQSFAYCWLRVLRAKRDGDR